MLPKNKIPTMLTGGLFTPEYIDRNVPLNDLLQEVVIPDRKKDAGDRVIKKALAPIRKTDIPVPLTELEAEEADRQIANTQQRIVAARNKLTAVRQALDEAVNTAMDGKELSFKVDVKKKPSIRRALRKLYGENLNTITYSMYKEMLEAKSLLEQREVSNYSEGKTRSTDEEEE